MPFSVTPPKFRKPWQRCLQNVLVCAFLAMLVFNFGQKIYQSRVSKRYCAWEENGGWKRWLETNAPLHLPSPGADAVLLVHGFADGPSVWEKMAPVFAEEGFEVLAPLHGGWNLEQTRRILDKAIADARRGDPGRRVWLVGHSLGGTLAFDTALRGGNRIAGVALIAPFFDSVARRTLGLTAKQWYRVWKCALPGIYLLDQQTPLHPRLDGDGASGLRTRRFLYQLEYDCLFDAADAVRDRAADWRGPLRVDLALDDEIVDTEAARRFFRGATNAAPAIFEEHPGGHVLPLSSDAEFLARDIARFFSNSRAAATDR